MALLIEGIGSDWVVTRRPGGKPELSTFNSLDELTRVMRRCLVKAEKTPLPPEAPPAPPPPPAHKFDPTPLPVVKDDVFDLGTLPPGTDCRTCGACCSTSDASRDVHVKLTPEDAARIPVTFRDQMIVTKPDGKYLRTKKNQDGDTVCVALKGSVGGSCKCTIYPRRPEICRKFEVASLECLLARKGKGM